jgi:O-antigen/teichoic acid export membrane protein
MRVDALVKRSFLLIGAWDSAVVSLSGFLTNVLTGRFLAMTDYGLFTTAFIMANMAILIQSSFTSSPYAILAPRVEAAKKREYLAASVWITAGSSIATGILLGLPMFFFFRKGLAGVHLALALSIFAFYAMTVMLQDFARRACFAHNRESAALLLDVVSSGGQVLLLILFRAHLSLNGAILIVAGTTMLGLAAVYLGAGKGMSIPLHFRTIRDAARDNFILGKWLFITSGVSWIANQVYLLAVAAFQTPVVMAQLSVARTIAAVSNPAVMTVDNMGTPRASRLAYEKGPRAVRGFIAKITAIGSVPFIVLGAVCFIYPAQAVHILFHRSFGDISALVRVFSLMPFMWFAGRSIIVGINALKKPRVMLPVYAVIACVTLTAGIYLARKYGAMGAAIGLLFNSALMVIGFLIQFLRISGADPDAAGGEFSEA